MFSMIYAMGASGVTNEAVGTSQASSGTSMLMTLGMIVLFIGIMYFLMIRPQKKRDKEAQQMLASLKRGDKVVTIGGIRGKIVAVRNDSVILKIDSNTKMELNKTAISQVLVPSSGSSDKVNSEDIKNQDVVNAPDSEENISEDAVEEKTDKEKNLSES